MFVERQFYTLIIAPARSSRLYRIILGHRHLYVLAGATLAGILIVASAAVWLVKHAALLVNYQRVQGENRALRAEFSTTLAHFHSRLQSIEEQSQRLAERAQEMGMEIEIPTITSPPNSTGSGGPEDIQSFAVELQRVEEDLRKLQVDFVADKTNAIPTGWPTQGRMTAGFGLRKSPFGGQLEFHSGQDISAPYGQVVYATAGGIVVFASYRPGYGNLVVIDHGQGTTTLYGHLSSILVGVRERVERGLEIGEVGSSGRSSGAHVHYEIRVDDRPVNPSTYTGD